MDLLLTGASGFIGRNLILRAPPDWRILAVYCKDTSFPDFLQSIGNPNICAVPCDLGDAEQVSGLFRNYGADWEACLFLAGKVDIPWSVREPKQDLLQNVLPILNLLETLKTRRFIYFSSGAVYDGLEGQVQPQVRLGPTLPYAISKLTCEQYVHFYHQRRRSIENYLIVRFFGAYGPYEAPHKIYTRLIQTFALEGKDSYTIYGDGTNLIDAMYVSDAINAVMRILTGNYWNDTVNLAGGHPQSIESLVLDVGKALGIDPVKIYKQGVANESNDFWGSTGEMREHFGFEAKTMLSEGVTLFKKFLADQRNSTSTIQR